MRKSAIVAFVLLASFVAQSPAQACMGGFGWGPIRSQPQATLTVSDLAVALIKAKVSWRTSALIRLREAGCRIIWGGNNHRSE